MHHSTTHCCHIVSQETRSCRSLPEDELWFGFDQSVSAPSVLESPACFSWQPPHPCRKAGCPCSVSDKADSGNLDRCWCSAAFRWLGSKHQIPCHTRNKWKINPCHVQRKVTRLWDAYATDFYLIHIMTVGTISTETCWARATVPGSIWRAVALHSSKAWVGQAAIYIRLAWQECHWWQMFDACFLLCEIYHCCINTFLNNFLLGFLLGC